MPIHFNLGYPWVDHYATTRNNILTSVLLVLSPSLLPFLSPFFGRSHLMGLAIEFFRSFFRFRLEQNVFLAGGDQNNGRAAQGSLSACGVRICVLA